MVLYPLNTFPDSAGSKLRHGTPVARGRPIDDNVVSAWEGIEKKQKQNAEAWWLIAQPDTAALAGDLVASIACFYFPKLEPDVVDAISLHGAAGAQSHRTDERIACL